MTTNKKIKLLIVAAALTLPVWAAATASAGPDCTNPKFFDHPLCATTPPSSTTTTSTPDTPTLEACSDEITISGTGRTSFECLWTPNSNNGSEVGTVKVAPISGAISQLVVFVRDGSPGDICVLKQEWDEQTGPEFEASFPLADERGTYWQYTNPDDGLVYIGEHWCEPYDPVSGQREDPNGEPLHLQVSFVAKKDTGVKVSLFPGQATP